MMEMPVYRVLNSYIHLGRIGVLAEFGCDSDFVAKSEGFRSFMNDVTMHIAANGAPDIESLHEQPFFKDETRKVSDILDEASHKFREGICVLRFVRWSIEDYERPVQSTPPLVPAVISRFGHP
jgi:elongation factor Ts